MPPSGGGRPVRGPRAGDIRRQTRTLAGAGGVRRLGGWRRESQNAHNAVQCHFDERKGPKIAEQLMEIQHKYPGREVVNVGQPVGTPEAVIREQRDRFVARVMPAFKRT